MYLSTVVIYRPVMKAQGQLTSLPQTSHVIVFIKKKIFKLNPITIKLWLNVKSMSLLFTYDLFLTKPYK